MYRAHIDMNSQWSEQQLWTEPSRVKKTKVVVVGCVCVLVWPLTRLERFVLINDSRTDFPSAPCA